jgi:hypothetical protein
MISYAELSKVISERLADLINKQPAEHRHSLTLLVKFQQYYSHEVSMDKCVDVICYINNMSRDSKVPNFAGLQINKLIYVSDEEFRDFAIDMSIEKLKLIISEEKTLIDNDIDIIDREYIDRECEVCGHGKFEVVNSDIKKYHACCNCWMPIF